MSGMSLAQKFATVFGGVYVLIGVVGFLPFVGGTIDQDGSLLLGIFGVTALHNVVHLLVGFAFLAGAKSDAVARTVCTAIGAVYLLVAIIGFVNIDFVNELLNLNLADNLLHLATGGLALGVGLAGKNTSAA